MYSFIHSFFFFFFFFFFFLLLSLHVERGREREREEREEIYTDDGEFECVFSEGDAVYSIIPFMPSHLIS
jgi:hypothetical protein